jgi:hypothetical protein
MSETYGDMSATCRAPTAKEQSEPTKCVEGPGGADGDQDMATLHFVCL